MRCSVLSLSRFIFSEARNIYLFGRKRFVYILKGFCLGCELARLCPRASPCCKQQRGCFHTGLGLPGPSNLCVALSRTTGFQTLVYTGRRWIHHEAELVGCSHRHEPRCSEDITHIAES